VVVDISRGGTLKESTASIGKKRLPRRQPGFVSERPRPRGDRVPTASIRRRKRGRCRCTIPIRTGGLKNLCSHDRQLNPTLTGLLKNGKKTELYLHPDTKELGRRDQKSTRKKRIEEKNSFHYGEQPSTAQRNAGNPGDPKQIRSKLEGKKKERVWKKRENKGMQGVVASLVCGSIRERFLR